MESLHCDFQERSSSMNLFVFYSQSLIVTLTFFPNLYHSNNGYRTLFFYNKYFHTIFSTFDSVSQSVTVLTQTFFYNVANNQKEYIYILFADNSRIQFYVTWLNKASYRRSVHYIYLNLNFEILNLILSNFSKNIFHSQNQAFLG